jgi:hypothetical protein
MEENEFVNDDQSPKMKTRNQRFKILKGYGAVKTAL